MKKRVIARKRGVIPGCIPAGQDSHMAVDSLGRPWPESGKTTLHPRRLARRTREETRQSRNRCGCDPRTALIAAPGPGRRNTPKSVCNGGSAEHHQLVEASGL